MIRDHVTHLTRTHSGEPEWDKHEEPECVECADGSTLYKKYDKNSLHNLHATFSIQSSPPTVAVSNITPVPDIEHT